MPKEPLLNAAIVSLFCELAQRAADSDGPDYQDAESLQLFDFLEDTVRSSSSDDAFGVFACYAPSEHALADVWPRFWHSVECFCVSSPQQASQDTALEGVSGGSSSDGAGADDGLAHHPHPHDDDTVTHCTSACACEACPPRHAALLRLDHMRRPKPYARLISSWAQNLSLSGFLLFSPHLILIFISGSDAGAIHRYLQLHRTQTVDVDSQGRPCREKMLTVLWQQQQQQQQQHEHHRFRVLHAPSLPAAIDILTTQTFGAISRDCLKDLGFKL